MDQKRPSRAVIVGAGFIGLEMAENLHAQGIFVTIIEMAEQVMNILDYEMAAEVHQHLKTKNVEFYLNDGVDSFNQVDEKLEVKLNSGRRLPTDMVILSIGVRPENQLAKAAGLEIGKTNGIVVNKFMQTNDPDIYALGDVIEFENPLSGTTGIIPLAGPANKQGRIVADNIVFGNTKAYPGTIATGIAKVFDLTVASTGLPEKALKQLNIPHRTFIIHLSDHAGYYPGAIPMTIKVVFAPRTGRLLGAQIVGFNGVDKRIDLFATIIGMNGTIWDLQNIEHSYAPPYSSAKDPVNVAGFVAENIFEGTSRHIQWSEIVDAEKGEVLQSKYTLLDVRSPEENAHGAIPGSLNIPHTELRERIKEVPQGKPIVVYCGVGLRGYLAERILRQSGFEQVYNLSGGYQTYSIAMQKQSNEDVFEGYYIGKDDHIYQSLDS
jgi:rhodanese-related sulfurtransferase